MKNMKRTLATAMGGSLIVAGLPAAFTSSTVSAQVDTTVVQGQVLAEDGSPAPFAPIQASALHPTVDGIQTTTMLGDDVTDAEGRYEILFEASPDKRVEAVEVTAVVEGVTLLHTFPLGRPAPARRVSGASMLVARAEIPASVTLQAGLGLVSPGKVSRRNARASAFDGEAPVVAAPGEVDHAVDEPDATDAPDIDAVEGSSNDCSGGYYIWGYTQKRKSVWDPLKSSKTLGKSRLIYHWTTSTKTDLGTAVNPENGSNYGGGLEASREEMSGLSVKPDWPNNTSKMVRMKWRYREKQRFCYYAGEPGTYVAQQVFKWVPEKTLEYTKSEYNNPDFTCNTTGPISSRTEFTQSTTVRWTGWFEIIGVALSSTQTQAEATKLVVDPDSGQTPRYCGSNSLGLGRSAFVREVSS